MRVVCGMSVYCLQRLDFEVITAVSDEAGNKTLEVTFLSIQNS